MDLRTFGRALRRSWWVIVLTTVLGTGIAALVTAEIAPTYASKVTFLVTTPNAGSTNALQAQQVAQLQVNSYVELLTSDGLAERLIGSPGLGGLSETDIESRITPSTPTNTSLITATVVDTSKKRAYALTDAIRVQFPKMVADLASAADNKTTLARVSGPRLESAPVGPHKTLNIGLGLLVGLALGLMYAFLRLLLDTSVRTSEQVEDATDGASVIGSIGFEKTAKHQPVIVTGGVRSVRAEGFRQLRTNLLFANVDKPVQVLVVTSTVPGEGKSTVSTNLGIVFAESGERVLLIEADLRKPRLADYLGLERAVGLTNVLAGQVELDDVLQTWGNTGLSVLTSGSLPPNPSEMLGSDHMRELMQTLRARFDVIVIDTPPLLPVTDAAVASSLADGAVLVVRHGKTSMSNLQQAARALRSVDARILGAVLNMRKSQVASRYGTYGYYEDAPVADVVAIAPAADVKPTPPVDEPEPAVVEVEPAVVEAEPEVEVEVEAEPEVVEPEAEVVEPEAEVVEPEVVEAEPEAVEPEPEVVEAEAEPEVVEAEPEPEVVEAEATSEPEVVEAIEAEATSEPEPVEAEATSEPEAVSEVDEAEPEVVEAEATSEPEPVEAEVEPEVVEPEPEVVEPEVVEPEPVAVPAEPPTAKAPQAKAPQVKAPGRSVAGAGQSRSGGSRARRAKKQAQRHNTANSRNGRSS